jgi:SAM-dependent methyltransferase
MQRPRFTGVAASTIALLLVLLLALACRSDPAASPTAAAAAEPEPAAQSTTSERVSGPESANTAMPLSLPAHEGPAPIDCPLRKAGIDPHGLRPFAEADKYIAFLERADRATWQRPDAVVSALSLRGDETVVDVGAGSGYFTFRLAAALPRGRVIALDIEPEMVRHVHHRAMQEGLDNVEARLISSDEPDVPEAADLVFICDVLHHVTNRPDWLAGLARQLESGTRLAVVEFREGSLPEGPPEAMKIPTHRIRQEIEAAGFSLLADHSPLLPYQSFLEFRRSTQ